MDAVILHEDRDIVVCVKPVGTLSEKGGMPEILAQSCAAKEIYTVHRLDRTVGGVMVYAKTAEAAAKLSAAMGAGDFKKQYQAVVHGRPAEDSGVMRDLLFKDSAKNKSYVVKRMRKGVKEAELEYSVIESRADMSLVKITLHTGRSHQIRVQFSSRKMPLVGDVKYGSLYRDCPISLWSWALSFEHPAGGERMRFEHFPAAENYWKEFEYITKGEQL